VGAAREAAVSPDPAFALEATSIGFMSGGSVFDARGLVVGMLSTSVEIDDDYVSTASLLW
jgi:hypothetical protein